MVDKRKLHKNDDRIGVAQNIQAVDAGLCPLHAAIHSAERIHNLVLDALCQFLPLAAAVVMPSLCPVRVAVARITVDGDEYVRTAAVGSGEGEKLSSCIQNQIVDALGTVDRGVKGAKPGVNGLYVLSNTNAVAVLVELAFIDHAGDAELLRSQQDEFARAIARGVTDYEGEC